LKKRHDQALIESMIAARVIVLVLAALLFGAAAFTAWNAAMIGDDGAIPARAGAWFFFGACLLTIELALARLGDRR
jgi:hypothetical protein